jgi:hypothetical protein
MASGRSARWADSAFLLEPAMAIKKVARKDNLCVVEKGGEMSNFSVEELRLLELLPLP